MLFYRDKKRCISIYIGNITWSIAGLSLVVCLPKSPLIFLIHFLGMKSLVVVEGSLFVLFV